MRSIPVELAQQLLNAYHRRSRSDESMMTRELLPGDTFIRQGALPENVFIVLEGRIKVHHGTPKGTEYLVAVEGTGEIMGEVEALTGEAYTCSVTAVKPSRVGVIPRRTYGRWLEEDHGFALLVNQTLCHRLQKATKRSAIHQAYPLEYSVLRLLRMLSEETGTHLLDVGKEEMANYLGTNTRSINRILKDLQERYILGTHKGIEILSMPDLEQAMRMHDN